MSHACAIDCCAHPPVVHLSYATRPPRSYLLCEHHHVEARTWVRSRFGDITITEEAPKPEEQPALFGAEEATR